jgi:magnesium-transporting ATPase (P-type)
METSLVVRGESKEEISNWDLAVGDVLELKAGDKVPAHCVVIEGFNLHPSGPFLLANTPLDRGYCTAVVANFGQTTYKREELGETELGLKLQSLKRTLTYIGLVFCLVILGGSVTIEILQTGFNSEVGFMIFLKKLMENLTVALMLLIVVIPEGL